MCEMVFFHVSFPKAGFARRFIKYAADALLSICENDNDGRGGVTTEEAIHPLYLP
jgi:hypothetical protein